MTVRSLYIPILIYILVPIFGIIYYIILNGRMRKLHGEKAPIIELFVSFFTYGGLLTAILTEVFWEWSGLASLGSFYLVFIAPFIMAYIGFRVRNLKKQSNYFKWIFYSSVSYAIIIPLTIIIIGIMNFFIDL